MILAAPHHLDLKRIRVFWREGVAAKAGAAGTKTAMAAINIAARL